MENTHNYAALPHPGDQTLDYRHASYVGYGKDAGEHGGAVYSYDAESGGFWVSASDQSRTGHHVHVGGGIFQFHYSHDLQYFPYGDWFVAADILRLTITMSDRGAPMEDVPDMVMSKFRIDRRFIGYLKNESGGDVLWHADDGPFPSTMDRHALANRKLRRIIEVDDTATPAVGEDPAVTVEKEKSQETAVNTE